MLSAPRGSVRPAIAFARRAHRRGRHAIFPFAYHWEQALERPLLEVRAELGIVPTEAVHPTGILRGSTDIAWTFGEAIAQRSGTIGVS